MRATPHSPKTPLWHPADASDDSIHRTPCGRSGRRRPHPQLATLRSSSAGLRVFARHLWRWPFKTLLLAVEPGLTQPCPLQLIFDVEPKFPQPLSFEFDDVAVHEAR